jgi:hypothetical protein
MTNSAFASRGLISALSCIQRFRCSWTASTSVTYKRRRDCRDEVASYRKKAFM